MQICNIYYEVNEDIYDNNCYTKEFLKYRIMCILYVDYIVDYMIFILIFEYFFEKNQKYSIYLCINRMRFRVQCYKTLCYKKFEKVSKENP